MLNFEFFLLHCSDEFAAGFGSHTPMILGQAKVVRYFPNYERLNLSPGFIDLFYISRLVGKRLDCV